MSVQYMTDEEAKKAIIDIGRRMFASGFVAANDGNITCRVSENAIWATPTGVSKGYMTENMLVKLDLNGSILEGSSKPSSEIKMHLIVYQKDATVMGVTHAHPPIATAFAVARKPLDQPILTEEILQLGSIPVAPYAEPGTQEMPDSVEPFIKQYRAVLLANHGVLTWGRSIYEAYYRLETTEYCAKLTMLTESVLKQQVQLTCSQVEALIKARKNRYGIDGDGVPFCKDKEC